MAPCFYHQEGLQPLSTFYFSLVSIMAAHCSCYLRTGVLTASHLGPFTSQVYKLKSVLRTTLVNWRKSYLMCWMLTMLPFPAIRSFCYLVNSTACLKSKALSSTHDGLGFLAKMKQPVMLWFWAVMVVQVVAQPITD